MKKKTSNFYKKGCLLATFLFIPFFAQTTHARESRFTASGNGPLYMNTYDYQNTNDTFLPEDRMQKTIDWMQTNFLEHGFEYVCLDGWIGGATRHTKNGYVTTHNDSWKQDWKYWADSCKQAGLKLGVYYPPYWVLDSIANDPSVKVEGTNYTIKSICSNFYKFQNWYLVDPEKPGAKEYVQGFIKYLIGQNVKFLKADFLGFYEDKMGTDKYITMLTWMKEACGDDLLLSFSAPNNHNHAENERSVADMLRLSQDCYAGGWKPFSNDFRNAWVDKWPSYQNAFDAFIEYSGFTGKNECAMDGDFTIAHSFANDEEIKSAVSLQLLAGASLGIGDDFDSINGKEWAFQNDELLALNKSDFVAKPLSNKSKQLNDSQVWWGKDGKGDWYVGLFNREKNENERTFSFKDLGITGTHEIKDLWTHKTVGTAADSYSVNLSAHACQVIKISKKSLTSAPTIHSKNDSNKDLLLIGGGIAVAGITSGIVAYKKRRLTSIKKEK